jgi:hypothetical protein
LIQATRNITRIWGNSLRDFRKAIYDALAGFKIGEVNIDLPNILANTTVDVGAIALPAGTAAVGDLVTVVPPAALLHGLLVQSARIAVADQLTVRVMNVTAGALDAAVGVWTYEIINASAPRPVAT